MTLVLALWMAFVDIASVKAEPDLEKRSDLALSNADHAIDEARQAYSSGDDKAEQAALGEVRESVDVSLDALEHSGKSPRKNRHYKNAELKLRALIRRLSGFRDEVSFDSRQRVEAVIKRLSDVHDQLLDEIMSKRKR